MQIPVIIAIILPVCMGCIGLCTDLCSRRRKSACWQQSDGDQFAFPHYWRLVAECEWLWSLSWLQQQQHLCLRGG